MAAIWAGPESIRQAVAIGHNHHAGEKHCSKMASYLYHHHHHHQQQPRGDIVWRPKFKSEE